MMAIDFISPDTDQQADLIRSNWEKLGYEYWTTRDMKTGKSVERIINHDDREHRQCLGKHAFWAMRNHHEVVTFPVIEEVAK